MTQVSGVLVRVLLDAVQSYGVSHEALLLGSPCTMQQLENVAVRIDLAVFRDLNLRALELTADPALGLHVAERASEAAFDLVGHLVSHAPTLRDALGLCAQFQSLFMDDVTLGFDERDGTARWRCAFVRGDPRFDAMWSEFILTGMQRALRVFAGSTVSAQAAYFEHPRPAHHAAYARIFRGAERFGQPFTGLDFSTQLLDRPQLHRHSELHAMLLSQAERALDRLGTPTSYSERLQHYFLACPPARIPDMRAAAHALGLGARSLRRRLAEEGVSYRELVQTALESLACHMLRDPRRSVQEVGHALGFSDVTAFHRAFKRWTGTTPQDYRLTHAK
jgi:AraC-like DNA-binding protein